MNNDEAMLPPAPYLDGLTQSMQCRCHCGKPTYKGMYMWYPKRSVPWPRGKFILAIVIFTCFRRTVSHWSRQYHQHRWICSTRRIFGIRHQVFPGFSWQPTWSCFTWYSISLRANRWSKKEKRIFHTYTGYVHVPVECDSTRSFVLCCNNNNYVRENPCQLPVPRNRMIYHHVMNIFGQSALRQSSGAMETGSRMSLSGIFKRERMPL